METLRQLAHLWPARLVFELALVAALFSLWNWCDARRRRRRILKALNAREDFADPRMRAEFGASLDEWGAQQRALHDIAHTLKLPAAKLRAGDALDFLTNQNWHMNDALLEFEFFIKQNIHRAVPENIPPRHTLETLGQLVRLLAQLGY